MDNSKLAELYAFAKICGYQGDASKFKKEYRKYYDEFTPFSLIHETFNRFIKIACNFNHGV